MSGWGLIEFIAFIAIAPLIPGCVYGLYFIGPSIISSLRRHWCDPAIPAGIEMEDRTQ